MTKDELLELVNLLEKFHSDDMMLEKIGGFQSEKDDTISDALNVIYGVLE